MPCNTVLKTFLTVIDENILVRAVHVKHLTKQPMITEKAVEKLRHRDRAHINKQFGIYGSVRNKVQNGIRKEKKNYFNTLVVKKTNSKDNRKAINTFKNTNKSSDTLPSSHIICDGISNVFKKREIDQLRATVQGLPSGLSLLTAFCESRYSTDIPSDISQITLTEVFTYFINTKNSNSPGLDGITNRILPCSVRLYVNHKPSYLTNVSPKVIFHKPLSSQKVYPQLKSGSLDSSIPGHNYPISFLSSLSKPLENKFTKLQYGTLTTLSSSLTVSQDFERNILVMQP